MIGSWAEPGARRTAAIVAISYCALGMLWMVGGGVVDIFRDDAAAQGWSQPLVRGLLFVLLSTIALFVVSLRLLTSHKRVEASLKRTTSELVQAQKLEAVGRLAASVAHDFNNVLTAIAGMAELLREDLPEESEWRREAEEILTTATRARGLTRQLLIFSGNSEAHRLGVDMNDAIVALMPMLRTTLGPAIELEVDMSADQPCVFMDPSRLDQVLMNLVTNARDAMPEGGKLVVESRMAHVNPGGTPDAPDLRPGDYAILIVSDTGMGMDADTMSRCFEPFFTTKARGHGTGLGLATVYGIIHEAGGYLSVYSEPGTGTTFKAYVPLMRDGAAAVASRRTLMLGERRNGRGASAARPTADVAAQRAQATVLIVEDESAVRRVAATAIGRCGYRVMQAANATEAVALAKQERVDLLFTDMVLPDISGGELAKQLLQGNPTMRILLTSGYTELSVRSRPSGGILAEGRAHFIEKPYSVGDLASRVEHVMNSNGNGRAPQ